MLDYYIATILSAKSTDAEACDPIISSGLHCTRPSTDRMAGGIGERPFLT